MHIKLSITTPSVSTVSMPTVLNTAVIVRAAFSAMQIILGWTGMDSVSAPAANIVNTYNSKINPQVINCAPVRPERSFYRIFTAVPAAKAVAQAICRLNPPV